MRRVTLDALLTAQLPSHDEARREFLRVALRLTGVVNTSSAA
jgi:hypothetical protein